MITMMRHVFDLDNTLIYTDSLNNDSYNYALKKLGLATINDCKRITRDVILSKYPEINSFQKNEIIELKQMPLHGLERKDNVLFCPYLRI